MNRDASIKFMSVLAVLLATLSMVACGNGSASASVEGEELAEIVLSVSSLGSDGASRAISVSGGEIGAYYYKAIPQWTNASVTGKKTEWTPFANGSTIKVALGAWKFDVKVESASGNILYEASGVELEAAKGSSVLEVTVTEKAGTGTLSLAVTAPVKEGLDTLSLRIEGAYEAGIAGTVENGTITFALTKDDLAVGQYKFFMTYGTLRELGVLTIYNSETSYISGSMRVPTEAGTLPININGIRIFNVALQQSGRAFTCVAAGADNTDTIGSCEWYLDGEKQENETGFTYTVPDTVEGEHVIGCFATSVNNGYLAYADMVLDFDEIVDIETGTLVFGVRRNQVSDTDSFVVSYQMADTTDEPIILTGLTKDNSKPGYSILKGQVQLPVGSYVITIRYCSSNDSVVGAEVIAIDILSGKTVYIADSRRKDIDADDDDIVYTVMVDNGVWQNVTLSLNGINDNSDKTFFYKATPNWKNPDEMIIQGNTDDTFVQIPSYSEGVSLGYFAPGNWTFDIEVRDSNGTIVQYTGSLTTYINNENYALEIVMVPASTGNGTIAFSISAPCCSVDDSIEITCRPNVSFSPSVRYDNERTGWITATLDATEFSPGDYILTFNHVVGQSVVGSIEKNVCVSSRSDITIIDSIEPGVFKKTIINPDGNSTLSLTITTPSNAVAPGTDLTLTATATSSGSSISGYQWYVNGVAQAGETNLSYIFNQSNPGYYYVSCLVQTVDGTSASNSARVTVNP